MVTIRWCFKSCGYRLTCLGVFLGFVQFVIGFSLPAWKRNSVEMIGLWQNCTPTFTDCQFYSTQTFDGWIDWVRAFEALSTVCYCVALFILVDLNCSKKTPDSVICDRCVLPTLCICTGLLGAIGVIVYAVYESDGHSSFSSGLYLSCVGSSFALICGILLICHKPMVYDDESYDTDSLDPPPVYHSSLNPVVYENRRTLYALETDVFY